MQFVPVLKRDLPMFFFSQVSDTAKQPNVLRDQVFRILVTEEEVTTAVPTPAPGTKLGISVSTKIRLGQ